ncbi:MAG: flagellin, partial [Deltaproteobacteria bacterium]|nr:flagellin [Deltaproteobacteria bacterium]
MAITIGSNISSLRTQRALGQSGSSLSRTFERLSSGQRINKASDDSAGLSIVS